jgi:hypothetical protein
LFYAIPTCTLHLLLKKKQHDLGAGGAGGAGEKEKK